MSDPNVKQVRLVGDAAGLVGGGVSAAASEEGTRRRRGGGRRNSRKILQVGIVSKEGGGNQQGGGATSPGTLVQLATTSVPGVAGGSTYAAPVGVNAALTQKGSEVAPLPAPPIKPLEPGAPTGTPQTGGAAQKPVKVVLGAKKKAKVVLAPAAAKPAAAAAAATASHTSKASRRTRKIKVSMRGLTKKIKKARTIRQKASNTTVEQIKKELHKAGLVKMDTKAPEPILRQMYADFMTLKSRAL